MRVHLYMPNQTFISVYECASYRCEGGFLILDDAWRTDLDNPEPKTLILPAHYIEHARVVL